MAILKRGVKRGLLKKTKEAVWPSMGWPRTLNYYRHRFFRTGDSSYKITAGLATGVAVSFTPFLGTHFLQALFFSWVLRANLLAGFVGTAFGNFWTFPPILYAGYKLGVLVCGLFGLSDFVSLADSEGFGQFAGQPGAFFHYMWDHPLKFLLPLTVGGYLCALISWPVAYLLLYYPVRAARKTYLLQQLKRRKKQMEPQV